MSNDRQVLSRLVKNMKQRGIEPLRPAMDQYLLERDRSPNRVRQHIIDMRPRLRPGGRFSPSSIGGCRRQSVFKYLNVRGRRRTDLDLELLFEDGNWRHHKWQAIFSDMEAVLGRDRFRVVSFEEKHELPELYIAGNSDIIVQVFVNGRWYTILVDFKGINRWGWEWVFAQDEPKEEHVKQVITYGKMAGRKRLSVMYDHKDNSHIKIYPVEFSQSVWQEVQEWVEECINNMNAEELPPMHPDCESGNFLWAKCPYASVCYGDKTTSQIRRRMYLGFPGVEEAWEAGRTEIREDESVQVRDSAGLPRRLALAHGRSQWRNRGR